jgi:sn-glycerol 3-phosphate transport system ATP-binding protein
MNLLVLEPAHDGVVIAGTTGPAVAPRELAGSTLGVRPEHVALGRDAGVDARVDAIEYLGADSLLTCRVGGQTLAVRTAGRVGLSQGDATRLSWARGAQHFFDGTSGRRSQAETSRDSATMFA